MLLLLVKLLKWLLLSPRLRSSVNSISVCHVMLSSLNILPIFYSPQLYPTLLSSLVLFSAIPIFKNEAEAAAAREAANRVAATAAKVRDLFASSLKINTCHACY